MYEYTQLNLTALSSFTAFIPPETLSKITSFSNEIKLIAFGAFQEGLPVGICIASLDTGLDLLEILHLEVDPKHRKHHIGSTLFSKIQEEATKQGAKIFSFIYPLNTPETPAIEKILKNNQWKGTRPFLIRGLFNPETFNAPMVHLNYKYPPGFKEFLWKNLKPNQRNDLLSREKQRHFPRQISPFNEEKIIEPLNSLGLEHEGRVVGWLITHRIDPETIRYSVIYIEPSLKFRGLIIKLLADSMLLHMKKPTKWAVIEIPYLLVHPSWIHFIEKRLLPSAVEVTRYRQGWHTIP